MTSGLTRNTYTQTDSPARCSTSWCNQRRHGAAPSARVPAAFSRPGSSRLREHARPMLELVLCGSILPNLGHGQGNGAITRLGYGREYVGRGGWGFRGESNRAPSEELFQNSFYQTFFQLVKETESRRSDLGESAQVKLMRTKFIRRLHYYGSPQ